MKKFKAKLEKVLYNLQLIEINTYVFLIGIL